MTTDYSNRLAGHVATILGQHVATGLEFEALLRLVARDVGEVALLAQRREHARQRLHEQRRVGVFDRELEASRYGSQCSDESRYTCFQTIHG